ncbi:unnamed protein product [Larinioides sclopetarius]|uniref:Uncharacterized protein n=1 Tax=Larinioides sclopetarius TaxID=280406 RepID=A0AAV2B5H1_9ARAC
MMTATGVRESTATLAAADIRKSTAMIPAGLLRKLAVHYLIRLIVRVGQVCKRDQTHVFDSSIHFRRFF